MILLILALWLSVVLLLSHATRALMMRASSGFVFRIVIFPGIVLHELSHYAMCKLTGARVQEVKLFDRERVGRSTIYRGHVLHGPSKLPYVGDPLISFAPLIGGLLVLALLTWAWNDPLSIRGNAARAIDPITDVAGVVGELASMVVSMIRRLPRQIAARAADWRLWVYLYLAVSISMSLAPSRQDFANSFRHLLRHALVFFLVTAAVVLVAWLASRWGNPGWFSSLVVRWLFGLLAFTLCVQLVGLLVAAAAAGISSLWRRA